MSTETPISSDGLQPACETVAGHTNAAPSPEPSRMDFSTAGDQGSDFASVNQDALAVLPALLQRWLPDGEVRGDEYVALNPTRDDTRPGSFSVNMETGKWADFATDDAGGDVISLVAYLAGIGQAVAAHRLSDMLAGHPAPEDDGMFAPLSSDEMDAIPHMARAANGQADKVPIIPVPADAPPMRFKHPGHGEPSQSWKYHDAEDRLVGYAARFDYINAKGEPDKVVLPVTYCKLPGGQRAWRAKGIPPPRPLYCLPEILSRPDAPVIVAEGEKTADAARQLFPGCVATTPMHGSKSPHQTDWSPVAGRAVVIAADWDEAGRAYAEKVARLCHEAGAAKVSELDFPARLVIRDGVPTPRDGNVPKGWDLADAVADRWTPELVERAGQDGTISLTPFEVPASGSENADAIGTIGTNGLGINTGPSPFEPLDMSVANFSRREPPPFPLEVLGDFWKRFVERGSDASSAPVDYVAATLLSSAAALIGNSRWVSPWHGWKEPTVFWFSLVGDPSSGKTPAKSQVLPLVKEIEQEMGRDFPEKRREWATKAQAAQVAQEQWEAAVKAAVEAGKDAPLKPEAAEAPQEPVKPRIMISDATIEVVALLLAAHPRGLGLHRDELAGWLGSMNKYGGQGDRAFWLEAYSGLSYTVDRVRLKGVPIQVPHNSVSVLGSIQPDALSKVLLEDMDDGLVARFLWCWPKPVSPRRPKTGMPQFDVEAALKSLATLEMIDPPKPDDPPRPVVLGLSEEAVDLFVSWRRDNASGEEGRAGLLASHFGKMPGLLLRLALVLEHLWWCGGNGAEPPKQISKAAVQAAMTLIEDYWKPMAERTFGDAALPDNERKAATLARWLLKKRPGVVNARDLRRNTRLPGLRTAGDVNAALEVLREAGWVRLVLARDGAAHGRQRKDYEINPEVYETG